MDSTTENDPLRFFEERKRQVLDVGERLRKLAGEAGDSATVSVLNDFMERFRRNRFLLLVVGDFKSGKSSLVNAILGRIVCPVKATPRTAKITRIVAASGEAESVEISFKDDRPKERRLLGDGPLEDLVAVDGKRTDEVELVDVELRPADTLLRHHVRLVDTPGLGSSDERHTKITNDYIRHADALLFVFSASKPFSESERDFLLTFRGLIDRTVFVVNQIDRVPQDEQEDVLKHIAAGLEKSVLPEQATLPPLLPISSLKAIEATRSTKASDLDASGLPTVVHAIEKSLAGPQAIELLRTVGQRQLEVVGIVSERLDLAMSALKGQRPAVDDLRDQVDSLNRKLGDESSNGKTLVDRLSQAEESRLESVGAAVRHLRSQIRQVLITWINGCPSEAMCKRNLPAFLARLIADMLERQDENLISEYQAINAEVRTEMARIARSMEEATRGSLRLEKMPATDALSRGVAALSGLGALAGDLGGPIEGYGLAKSALAQALAPSKEVQVLSVAAAVSFLLAGFAGPVGWIIAGVTGLLAAILGLNRAASWKPRVLNSVVERLDAEVLPLVDRAVRTSVSSYFSGQRTEVSEQVRAIRQWLLGIVRAVSAEAERADDLRHQELARIEDRVRRAQGLQDELQALVSSLPAPPPPRESAPETSGASMP